MTSPTQRTLKHLRDAGYPLVQVVEKWNPHAHIRQDLYGIIDVLAVGADIVGVQATSGSNVASRLWPIDPIRYAWEHLNGTPLPQALWRWVVPA